MDIHGAGVVDVDAADRVELDGGARQFGVDDGRERRAGVV
jgi:hypothetical protein